MKKVITSLHDTLEFIKTNTDTVSRRLYKPDKKISDNKLYEPITDIFETIKDIQDKDTAIATINNKFNSIQLFAIIKLIIIKTNKLSKIQTLKYSPHYDSLRAEITRYNNIADMLIECLYHPYRENFLYKMGIVKDIGQTGLPIEIWGMIAQYLYPLDVKLKKPSLEASTTLPQTITDTAFIQIGENVTAPSEGEWVNKVKEDKEIEQGKAK